MFSSSSSTPTRPASTASNIAARDSDRITHCGRDSPPHQEEVISSARTASAACRRGGTATATTTTTATTARTTMPIGTPTCGVAPPG